VAVGGKLSLSGVPCRLGDQSRVLTRMADALVLNLADIKRVGQDLVEMTAGKGEVTGGATSLGRVGFCRKF
jgi:hypothetical protein